MADGGDEPADVQGVKAGGGVAEVNGGADGDAGCGGEDAAFVC
jgi:hypothetical protein